MAPTNKYSASGFLLLFFSFLFFSCTKENKDLVYGVDPNQYEMINKALVIGAGGKCIDGDMPSPTGTGFVITQSPTAVQVTAGILLFFNYSTSQDSNLCSLYLQIDSADSYWEVPIELDPTSKQPYLKILIPNFIKNGNYNLKLSVADCNGNISPVANTNLNVTDPLTCGADFSGSVGITAMVANLGNKAGKVRVSYEMFSIPDRIDVRYAGSWQASSGTLLPVNGFPSCAINNGFVSGNGFVEFNYNPSQSKLVEIYVSGCNSGTAWTISIICP